MKTPSQFLRMNLGKTWSIQTNKHPEIWSKISETLHELYDDDPRELLKEGNYRIENLTRILQKEKKPHFPYLGGPKLSNYVLAVLHWFTDAEFEDLHNMSIISDRHIIKSTVELGLIDGAADNVSASDVEAVWRPILKQLRISPPEMHSTLRNWSRNNFEPTV